MGMNGTAQVVRHRAGGRRGARRADPGAGRSAARPGVPGTNMRLSMLLN